LRGLSPLVPRKIRALAGGWFNRAWLALLQALRSSLARSFRPRAVGLGRAPAALLVALL